MKKLLSLFLLLSLTATITSCDPDDGYTEGYQDGNNNGTTELPKRYALRIGTAINYQGAYESDPEGSLILKKNDGSTFTPVYTNISVVGEINYKVEGPYGSFDMTKNVNTSINTDGNGDFHIDLKINMEAGGERITKIESVDMKLITIVANDTYETNIIYSNDSVWDMVTGLSTALFTYGLTDHGTKFWAGSRTTSRYIDINENIILEQK